MPTKYHIKIEQAPPRFSPVPEYCQLENEGCLGCLDCVKRDSCVYDVYSKREYHPWEFMETGDVMCLNCFRCIQECKKNILARVRNPQYDEMGDDYWKPDLIRSISRQAETGKIPVSGAGYRGPFSGPGFDRMWTDMSEIVRPTRDGIHGREYISTVIDLGKSISKLEFDENGGMVTEPPPYVELPVPMLLEIPEKGNIGESVGRAVVEAARSLGTAAVVDVAVAMKTSKDDRSKTIVKFDPRKDDAKVLDGVGIAQLEYKENVTADIAEIKKTNPDLIFSVRLPMDENVVARVAKLAADNVDVLHMDATANGVGMGSRADDFLTDIVAEVHEKLVDDGVRERVTLLVSGGIALAEHVAKTIICGADGVVLDTVLLLALECRLCKECGDGFECPVGLEDPPLEWATRRIVNLVGSWHSQLLEVLGAMGIREVRRLRGERGRAMFFEELERDCFGPVFGKDAVAPEPVELPDMPEKASPKLDGLATPCPSRFRNHLGKFKVVRTTACVTCGKCAEVCAYEVHVKAGERMLSPKSYLCAGPETCRAAGAYCVDNCPEDALIVGPDPMYETFGDPRWTNDLLLSTWIQSETGKPPTQAIEHKVGGSGGGFDLMDFRFPKKVPDDSIAPEDIDLSIPINRRGDDRPEITIGFPAYGGGMSFGSISLATMISRARAWKAFDSFTCSGEGGYPDALKEYDDNVITQMATGLFGVKEETIQRVKIVEFKYAQGAKPGLGGHLLGDKVTPAVAKMREAVEGTSLFSPFPFHSVYSVEDHKKHVDWIKAINSKALIAVKVSTPTDVDMVAVGSYYAGAHIIHLDGSYGGTGAAPDIAKKNIAMPIEYAIPKVHQFLIDEGIRDKMTFIVSGGVRTVYDIAKAIALGADGVVIGTSELVALECIRCGNCESGRGCPRGIATTDPELSAMYDSDWGAQRIINLFCSWTIQLRDILRRFGFRSVRQLVGRSDLLEYGGNLE